MLNGAYIKMVKGTEKRLFFMFDDGEVREMTHGVGKIIKANDFVNLYNDLVNKGFEEVA